jgi:hypothetical protein
MKIHPAAAELFQADRQTGADGSAVLAKLIAAFRIFAKAPKRLTHVHRKV